MFPLPLRSPDTEPSVDLQRLAQLYDQARFGLTIDYTQDPPPPLSSESSQRISTLSYFIKATRTAVTLHIKHKTMEEELAWLAIGRIVAPQGLQGEVRVYPDSDFPERFLVPGTRWLQRSPQADPEPVALLRGRYIPGKNLFVLRLEGVETREQAEALRNAVLLVPADSRPTLAEGEYHVADLVGLEVFDRKTQTAIGVVVDVMTAGNDLLQVKLHELVASNSKERLALIPFVEAIVPVVDLVARRVEIEPPEGLLEL